jgi:signal transduction histidine kinase
LAEFRATSPEAAERGTARRLLGLGGNPLAKVVGRLPAKVRTKLLVAFLAIAALLVAVALLGLRVLGQSNSRAERLGALQTRAIGYQALETEARQFRALLALCGGGTDTGKIFPGGEVTPACLRSIDRTVESALGLLGETTRLGFTPASDEAAAFRTIRTRYARLTELIPRITASKTPSLKLHADAERLAVDLEIAAQDLATSTQSKTRSLIALNRSSYANSRDLVIGVAGGALGLALLLGLVLAWSLIDPIQRIGGRVGEIAAGDFSRHVDVTNRDELGTLAENVNRMNDELQRLYSELESASTHKSEFLANMSHELRTPLNAIIGFSQVLQQKLFGEVNEKQLEYLEDILSSANHLLALINDVLDLSKVEAGQVELEMAPFSLHESLERGVVMVRERAVKGGVQLSLESDPHQVVEADERRIRQVVFNLLSNAVKFTPAGGTVDVRSARLDGEVRVSVIDTGPGIAPEDQERIFEEFQQTDVGADQREGTGLGLALSKKLVELHGGRIWVESTQGEGSTFTFTLPVGS